MIGAELKLWSGQAGRQTHVSPLIDQEDRSRRVETSPDNIGVKLFHFKCTENL